MPDTYSIPVYCDNCDKAAIAEVRYGTPVPPKILCPNCGCLTARKNPQKFSEKRDWLETYPWIKGGRDWGVATEDFDIGVSPALPNECILPKFSDIQNLADKGNIAANQSNLGKTNE